MTLCQSGLSVCTISFMSWKREHDQRATSCDVAECDGSAEPTKVHLMPTLSAAWKARVKFLLWDTKRIKSHWLWYIPTPVKEWWCDSVLLRFWPKGAPFFNKTSLSKKAKSVWCSVSFKVDHHFVHSVRNNHSFLGYRWRAGPLLAFSWLVSSWYGMWAGR